MLCEQGRISIVKRIYTFYLAPQVERFLFRPGLQARARYYAILFLNQLALSHKVGCRAPCGHDNRIMPI